MSDRPRASSVRRGLLRNAAGVWIMNAGTTPTPSPATTPTEHRHHAYNILTPDAWARAVAERSVQMGTAAGAAADAPMTTPIKLFVELVRPDSATDSVV